MNKAAIYTRVSTKKQNTDRQIAELREYAARQGFEVVYEVSEIVTGKRNRFKRPGMDKILNMARNGEILEVLCLETSRLGRNALDVRNILGELTDHGVCTHIVNKNFRTLDKTRKKDFLSNMMLGFVADFAELELEEKSSMIISGIEEAKRQGRVGGRKIGATKPLNVILEENKKAVKLIKAGHSIREVAKLAGISASTVQKIKKALDETGNIKNNR